MRMTLVFEIYEKQSMNEENIQYEFFLSLVNMQSEGINGVSKTSFSFLHELMKLATAHPPVGQKALYFLPEKNSNGAYCPKFNVTYSIQSLQNGIKLAFKEVESKWESLLMDFALNKELNFKKMYDNVDSLSPGYSFLIDSRNTIAIEERMRF
ncbi:hypothetical protein HDU92_000902, partial [Lobulomyces angularis]